MNNINTEIISQIYIPLFYKFLNIVYHSISRNHFIQTIPALTLSLFHHAIIIQTSC